MPNHLDRARDLILTWLRHPAREPSFLSRKSESELAKLHGTIARRFMKWAKKADFAFEVVKVNAEPPGFTLHWTHRGASFVGFKQPAAEAQRHDALLVCCAALLQNDWCLRRLGK